MKSAIEDHCHGQSSSTLLQRCAAAGSLRLSITSTSVDRPTTIFNTMSVTRPFPTTPAIAAGPASNAAGSGISAKEQSATGHPHPNDGTDYLAQMSIQGGGTLRAPAYGKRRVER